MNLNRIYSFYSSERPSYLVGLGLVIAGAAGWLHTFVRWPQPEWSVWLWTTGISWGAVLLLSVGRILITVQYQALRLLLRRHTGVLYDKRLDLGNVSLRVKTVSLILNSVEPTDVDRYAIGLQVGKSFYEDFSEGCRTVAGIVFEQGSLSKCIARWFRYDSSSGMGKFTHRLISEKPLDVEVTVENSFTARQGMPNNCAFMRGYLAGFFSALEKKEVVCKEEACASSVRGHSCRFSVRETMNLVS